MQSIRILLRVTWVTSSLLNASWPKGRQKPAWEKNTCLNPLTHLCAFPLPVSIRSAQKSPGLASLVGQPQGKPLLSLQLDFTQKNRWGVGMKGEVWKQV